MREGEPQPGTLDAQELEKEASTLIGIFTEKTDLNGSMGFKTESSRGSITHVIQKDAEILQVLILPANEGYGEQHLTIVKPIGSGEGAPVIQVQVFNKGKEYQKEPDSTLTNSWEAVDRARRIISQLPVPAAA